jgi:hypothetical protein
LTKPVLVNELAEAGPVVSGIQFEAGGVVTNFPEPDWIVKVPHVTGAWPALTMSDNLKS